MFTLNAAATILAQIDKVPEEQISALDKSLRNISQRVYLPPEDRQGRADLYSVSSICALRLLQAAMAFGLDRVKLEAFARYLQGASTGRRIAVDGGFSITSPIQEAIDRVKAGHTFDFNLAFYKEGRAVWSADWPHDDPEAESRIDAIFEGVPLETPLVTFSVHASRLIEELLPTLEALKG